MKSATLGPRITPNNDALVHSLVRPIDTPDSRTRLRAYLRKIEAVKIRSPSCERLREIAQAVARCANPRIAKHHQKAGFRESIKAALENLT